MTGWIKKRGPGQHQARYFQGYDAQGRRIYPSKTFARKKDAEKWLTARLREKDLGQYLEPTNITLDCFLDQWLETKKQKLRENTFYSYENFLLRYVRPEIGHLKLTQIRPLHIQQWQDRLLKHGLSGRSVCMLRAILSNAFKHAARLHLIVTNPVSGTETPASNSAEMCALTPEEAGRFLSCCRAEPFRLALSFALQTGLRPEELLGLQWADLKLEQNKRGECHVRRALLHLPGGGWKFSPLKTKNSKRTVLFPAELVAALIEHRRRQLEDRLQAGGRYENHDLVFCRPSGRPITRVHLVKKYFKPVLKEAGLPSAIRLYDLRHSFVTLSLIAGVGAETVSEQAGHATVAFTLDHYAHVLPVMQETACDKLEGLLSRR